MEIKNRNTVKKERILSYLIDYFLVLVLTIILDLACFTQIANSLPRVKENSTLFYESYLNQEDIIKETKLNDVSPQNYLKMCIKSSLDSNYFLGTEFKDINALNKENDPLYFYYFSYKINHLELYEDKYTYSTLIFLKTLQNSIIFEVKDDYYTLKKEVAIDVGDYIFNSNLSKKNEYEDSQNFITNLFKEATNDLYKNKVYLKNENNLKSTSSFALNVTFLTSLISFFISFLILQILIPFINKKHKTSGNIIFKIEPYFFKKNYTSLLIKKVVEFFTFSSSIFLELLIIRSSVFVQMSTLNISNFYYFIFFLIFSVLLSLLSLVFSFIKGINASLSEIFSLVYYKNQGEVIKKDG